MKMKRLPNRMHARVIALVSAFALSGVASAVRAQTINNASFEADAFAVSPGFISVNSPITGWTASQPGAAGLNPAGGTSPFANNGTIPNGAQVAFIQSGPGIDPSPALSTVVSGLTSGQTYKVNFRYNSRSNSTGVTNASLKVALDNSLLLNLSNLQSVGGTAAYRHIAFDFTAGADSHTLSLTNDRPEDSAVLLDDFSVGVWTSGWSVASWSDDASSGVDASRYYTHAYNFDSTAATATINGVIFRGLAGANPSVAGQMISSGFASQYTGADANTLTAAGGGSAILATRFIYNGAPESITIGGLTPGVEYMATFYSVGWDAPEYGRVSTFSAGSDRLTVNQNQFGNNNGIRVSYRYVAPASGVMNFTAMPVREATLHCYGFSNCEWAQTNPVAVVQPASQVSAAGSTATFRALVAGARPMSYQWLKDGATVLADQTNAVLSLSVADGSAAGNYSVVVANAAGSVTSAAGALAVGMIANPSFEAETFFVFPGYVSANGPISGWTSSVPTKTGLNPVSDGQSPFVNNGIIPDGRQAAFIQSTSVLSTVLSGLTPGQTYTLSWRLNTRAGYDKPMLRAAIDGGTALDMVLSSVGGAGTTNPWRYAAFDFTASGASHTLSLTNDAVGDKTVVVDDFRIAVSTSRWSYAAWNDDASSGVLSTGLYTHAYKFGTAVDANVNGVVFKGLEGVNPVVPGRMAAVGYPSWYLSDPNNVRTAGGGGELLARDFIYGQATQTLIRLEGLVPGVEYEAAIFGVAFDPKTAGRAVTFRVGSDRMTVNEDHFDNNNGIRVYYRYVAGPSGTIELANDAMDPATTFHTYGVANREVASTNAPSLYQQPRDIQWAGAGSTVILNANPGGAGPMYLQWQKDGVDLVGQTNVTLALAGLTPADGGVYTLVMSNAQGVAVSSNAIVQVGVPVINPSFEADAFTVAPGYISNNIPITGWNNSSPVAGINPISYIGAANNPNNSSLFANSGTVPDGRQVAFIQADSTMSQSVTGFTAGATYYIKFYENARAGYAEPGLYVMADGVLVVPPHTVTSGLYRVVSSEPFIATTDSVAIDFIKNGGDTLLLDAVGVLEVPPGPPEITLHPQPAESWVTNGAFVRFTASATGALPLTNQWQRNGVDLPFETNSILDILSAGPGQAGSYRMISSNPYGAVTSQVAVIRLGHNMRELFNTGVDDMGMLLASGAIDPHYSLTYSDDPAYPGPALFTLYDRYPIDGTHYVSNGPASMWLAPRSNEPPSGVLDVQPGFYTYRTTFLLDVQNPASSRIEGQWMMDNIGADIRLNGTSIPFSCDNTFTRWSPFVITNGFVPGVNTLEFVVSNAPPTGPSAARVELQGIGEALPPGLPLVVAEPQNTTVQNGGDGALSVVASGAPPLSYQWYRGVAPLADETNRLLRFTAADKGMEDEYRVVVSNGSGPVTSAVATLLVNLPPQPVPDKVWAVVDAPFSFLSSTLAANDTDADGGALGVLSVDTPSTNGGSVVLSGGSVTYTPMPGYAGDDVFTYTVGDGRGGSASTNVQVVVSPAATLGGAMEEVKKSDVNRTHITFTGLEGCPYTIQTTTNLFSPWTFLTNLPAGPAGRIELDDSQPPPAPPQKFYRAVYP